MALNEAWKSLLSDILNSEETKNLISFLKDEYKKEIVYPKYEDIFSCLGYQDPDKIRAVIVGQDPYHGVNQAHGLSFSVNENQKIPPSLNNIYKELFNDLKIKPAKHGCLIKWAQQGVLLLNRVLTVRDGCPNSHARQGWEQITTAIVEKLSSNYGNIVFILWGKSAQSLMPYIDPQKHLILEAAHPSPYSAANGFFGSAPFSKTNEYLVKHNKPPIDWSL